MRLECGENKGSMGLFYQLLFINDIFDSSNFCFSYFIFNWTSESLMNEWDLVPEYLQENDFAVWTFDYFKVGTTMRP